MATISDARILQWLEDGTLVVLYPTLRVLKLHATRRRYHLLSDNRHPDSGRRRVVLGEGSQRRLIYLNRLVWMDQHRQLIPEGHVIDHRDLNRHNDQPDNLRLQATACSHAQGYDCQAEQNYQSWKDWLDFIAFMGYLPPEDSPLWA